MLKVDESRARPDAQILHSKFVNSLNVLRTTISGDHRYSRSTPVSALTLM